jgi:glucose-1-phosphate adenylyltransferase
MAIRAVILAGGAGERLSVLSHHRAKPAVPFGGKYRIVDFALSNCVNSGIDDVLVLTQYSPRSLIDHIGVGQPWDLDRRHGGGIHVLQPYLSRTDPVGWYAGSADAVRRNLDVVLARDPSLVVLLAGDHVYKMDYRPFIETHLAQAADLTIAVLDVQPEEASRMGIPTIDEAGRIVGWEEKPEHPLGTLASMGVYVFSTTALRTWLTPGRDDFGKDVVPDMLAAGARVFAHRFEGYWRDVGTVDAFWRANLDLVALVPPLDLFDPDWLIHTRSEERSPAKTGPFAQVRHSLVSHGCIINGTVENSVLSPGVRVYEGASVRDSVIMLDAQIAPGAVVQGAVVDKRARIGARAVVGGGDDHWVPNIEEPDRLFTGITVVGKRAVVPPDARLGRNVRVDPDVIEEDWPGLSAPSGTTIHRRSAPPEEPDAETAPPPRAGQTSERTRRRRAAPAEA